MPSPRSDPLNHDAPTANDPCAPAPAAPLSLIGKTPLVELTHLSPRPGVRIFAKLEGANPTGSIRIIYTSPAKGRRWWFHRNIAR